MTVIKINAFANSSTITVEIPGGGLTERQLSGGIPYAGCTPIDNFVKSLFTHHRKRFCESTTTYRTKGKALFDFTLTQNGKERQVKFEEELDFSVN